MNQHINNLENENDLSGSLAHSIIRLINFIVDTFVWLILYFTIAYFFDRYFVRFNSYLVNYVYSISLGVIVFLAYYSVFEYYYHRTLGKLLTRTKVVNRDGNKITFMTIFKRTISRLIPFDIFYYLFSKNGLHDKLSNTLVIKTNTRIA